MADLANSLIRSRFLARGGSGRAGIVVYQDKKTASLNDRIFVDLDRSGVPVPRPINTDGTITLTTTRQLVAKESGSKVIWNSATAFTTTLPPVAEGLEFFIFVKLCASATGHVLAINAADTAAHMYGKANAAGSALAGTAAKGRLHTQATSVVGDALHVFSDGTDWYATPLAGTFAEQP